jgi:uncharacterized protein YndB with AHSA1/START domain
MTDFAFEPGPLAPVECETAGDHPTLVFVKDLRHPPERVWAALTDPAELSAWAPYTSDRNLGQVGDAILTMIDNESSLDLAATITRSEPPTLLEYSWGTDVLRWELAAMGTGTRLTLRHTVQSVDMVPKVAAGWHLCLVVAERLLDGRPIPPIRGADARNYGWDDLNEAYAKVLEIPVTEFPES